jgi:hypothetical protein
MCIRIVALVYLIFTTLTGWTDETLPVLKVGSDVYSNVTITTVTPTDIFFNSDQGMGNAKLVSLNTALQNHFKQEAAAGGTAPSQKNAETANSLPASDVIDKANAKLVMDEAILKVQAIVNQSVTHLKRTPDMRVSTYSPGWFHPGAIKPDFNTVDVRTTQHLDYDSSPYVTSDLNPDEAFIGPELEFNPMTKYFYTDRSVPKKKLTETEMLEINRLYRIIGRCEQKLNESGNLESLIDSENSDSWLTSVRQLAVQHKAVIITLIVALLGTLFIIRKRRAMAAENVRNGL